MTVIFCIGIMFTATLRGYRMPKSVIHISTYYITSYSLNIYINNIIYDSPPLLLILQMVVYSSYIYDFSEYNVDGAVPIA